MPQNTRPINRTRNLEQGTIIKSRATLVPMIQQALEERQSSEGSFIERLEGVGHAHWKNLLTAELLPRLKFAILSHRWFADEPDFATTDKNLHAWLEGSERASSPSSDPPTSIRGVHPPSFINPAPRKLVTFCQIARDHGYRLAWMDTCCIDKTSSAEYQESINSMFMWYRRADVCIVHLAETDRYVNRSLAHGHASYYLREAGGRLLVTNEEGQSVQWGDEWFYRGWTLQELLAPRVLKFYTSSWEEFLPGLGNDKANPQLITLLAKTTDIPYDIIADFNPTARAPFNQKIRWASGRSTTRGEDTAYCLLGIFNLPMAILYGEGSDNAFFRFQQEYMKLSNDHTIFDWHGKPSNGNSLLASHPKCFQTHEPSHIKPMVWYRNEHFWNRVFVFGLAFWIYHVNGTSLAETYTNMVAHIVGVWDFISMRTKVIADTLTYGSKGSLSRVVINGIVVVNSILPRDTVKALTTIPKSSPYGNAFAHIIYRVATLVLEFVVIMTTISDTLGEDSSFSRVVIANCFLAWGLSRWFFSRPAVRPLVSFYKDLFLNIVHKIGMFMTRQPELGFSLTNVGLRLKVELYNVWAEPTDSSGSEENENYRLIIGRYGFGEVAVQPGEITPENKDSLMAMCFGHNLIILKPVKEDIDSQQASTNHAKLASFWEQPLLPWMRHRLDEIFESLDAPAETTSDRPNTPPGDMSLFKAVDCAYGAGEGASCSPMTVSKPPQRTTSAAFRFRKVKTVLKFIGAPVGNSDPPAPKSPPQGREAHVWTKVLAVHGIRSDITPTHVRGSARLIYVR